MNKTFSELFIFQPKSKIKAGEGNEQGTVPFYTCSPIQDKFVETALYNGEALILGTGGNPTLHYAHGQFSTSTDCLVAYPNDGINAQYAYYYLLSDAEILEKGFKGSGLKHISKTYIKDIEIPIENESVQDKIVAALNKEQFLINRRQLQIETLSKAETDTFASMFGDPLTNPKGWPTCSLSEISKLERGRFSPRPRNDPKYYNGSYPFVQTGDINGCDHRLSTYTQTLNDLGIRVSKEFPAGTIMIALVGATVGATAILQRNVYAPDSAIGITVDPEKCTNVFLEMQLRYWRQWLLDYAPDAARANINLEILSPLQVIVPPLPLQLEFENKMNFLEEQKLRLRASLEILETTYKSTLQKAFNGELFQ
ncbi:restriction endonuclease subunit S [Gudongella oleilytica]|uniref:restriction endonuclease subunit S n=1 Tax=Gudongella oleilytica TaxID=1582259 RepID=UPI001F0C9768|nr:restriction endonuclease subunit S [Gudongella oleilytica]